MNPTYKEGEIVHQLNDDFLGHARPTSISPEFLASIQQTSDGHDHQHPNAEQNVRIRRYRVY